VIELCHFNELLDIRPNLVSDRLLYRLGILLCMNQRLPRVEVSPVMKVRIGDVVELLVADGEEEIIAVCDL
jgi:hypothetical protein